MDRNVPLTAQANVVKDLLDLTVANALIRTRLLAQAIMTTLYLEITQHAWHSARPILTNVKQIMALMTLIAIGGGRIVKGVAI